jgi:hypothetical protein
MRTAFLLLVLALFAAHAACTHTQTPGSPPEGVLDCGAEVVNTCAAQALGPVNTCLADLGDWQGCLAGLISPAVCGAETVVGCLVRHAGSQASAAAQVNQGDEVSARVAERSRAWIRSRGYVFAAGAGGAP